MEQRNKNWVPIEYQKYSDEQDKQGLRSLKVSILGLYSFAQNV